MSFRQVSLLILALVLPMLAGCPDYSHQRPVPDYKNMVDGGGEEGAEEAEIDAEERSAQ